MADSEGEVMNDGTAREYTPKERRAVIKALIAKRALIQQQWVKTYDRAKRALRRAWKLEGQAKRIDSRLANLER